MAPEKRAECAHPGRVYLAFYACRPALSGVRHERHPQHGFTGRLQGGGISPGTPCITAAQQPVFATAARLPQASVFRYYFDSNKARQTVR